MAWYSLFVRIGDNWELAKEGRMSRSAAMGLLSQFALQYHTRLMRGKEIGRLVEERGNSESALDYLSHLRRD